VKRGPRSRFFSRDGLGIPGFDDAYDNRRDRRVARPPHPFLCKNDAAELRQKIGYARVRHDGRALTSGEAASGRRSRGEVVRETASGRAADRDQCAASWTDEKRRRVIGDALDRWRDEKRANVNTLAAITGKGAGLTVLA